MNLVEDFISKTLINWSNEVLPKIRGKSIFSVNTLQQLKPVTVGIKAKEAIRHGIIRTHIDYSVYLFPTQVERPIDILCFGTNTQLNPSLTHIALLKLKVSTDENFIKPSDDEFYEMKMFTCYVASEYPESQVVAEGKGFSRFIVSCGYVSVILTQELEPKDTMSEFYYGVVSEDLQVNEFIEMLLYKWYKNIRLSNR